MQSKTCCAGLLSSAAVVNRSFSSKNCSLRGGRFRCDFVELVVVARTANYEILHISWVCKREREGEGEEQDDRERERERETGADRGRDRERQRENSCVCVRERGRERKERDRDRETREQRDGNFLPKIRKPPENKTNRFSNLLLSSPQKLSEGGHL